MRINAFANLERLVDAVERFEEAITNGVLEPTPPDDYDHKVMVAHKQLSLTMDDAKAFIAKMRAQMA